VREWAAYLGRYGAPRAIAAEALRAVQSLPVVADPPGREVFQPVAATLQIGGDCEDHSAALVTVLELNGIPTRLVWMTLEPEFPLNHISAQISLDGGITWQWAEPSVIGAQIGQHPLQAAEMLGDWSAFDAG
jgi:hypothetical protein